MARTDKKKTTSKSNDDATAGVQHMSLKDRDDESSDLEGDDDDKNEDDESVPMRGLPKVLGKSTPARSTRVEDRVICTTW
jgi:hypothetical protein